MKNMIMVEEVIKLMRESRCILAVDFTNIEFLGAHEQRDTHCTLYEDRGNFVPIEVCAFDLTEFQIGNIFDSFGGSLWVADDIPSNILSPDRTRYYAAQEPNKQYWVCPRAVNKKGR